MGNNYSVQSSKHDYQKSTTATLTENRPLTASSKWEFSVDKNVNSQPGCGCFTRDCRLIKICSSLVFVLIEKYKLWIADLFPWFRQNQTDRKTFNQVYWCFVVLKTTKDTCHRFTIDQISNIWKYLTYTDMWTRTFKNTWYILYLNYTRFLGSTWGVWESRVNV